MPNSPSNSPLVSVIVPTYNSAQFIEACLKSIKEQTYKNIELIVVDNNSKDNTKELAHKYTDKVFNKGPERSAQRNYGISESTGEYVVIIDSDMQLSPKVIESCVEEVSKNPELKGLVIPEESFGTGFWAQCKKLERSFYVGVSWMEAARFFSKEAYLSVGGYDESMVSGEDWDLAQRIEATYKTGRVNEFIYHNEGHLSLSKTLKKKFYYAKEFSKYTNKTESSKIQNQTGVFQRYALFFSDPVKLFKNPFLGVGMLFMKMCEFGFGALGLVMSNI
jgi:cellulose synthase/poly-beta-1,6-N-acetylglucosamine synthase-like glycosyltransferase